MVWLFFLAVYSIASACANLSPTVVSECKPHQVREPLDRIDPNYQRIDAPEVILYVLALSFLFDSKPFPLLSTGAL